VAEVVFEATSAEGNASQAQVVWTRPALRMESAAPVQEVQKVTPRETPHADNVLFIVLDACRADSMGCYGYARDTTPFIDTLARKGLLFERAYSAAPYTYSSTWSLYTSLFPFQHGAPMVPKRPSDSLPMIQKTLHDAGIVTGFACGNPWSFDTGMAKGYDEFLPAYEHIFLKNPPERTPGGVTHRAMDFMFRHRKERFFLYAHYMLPHEPYVPPAPFLNRFTTDLAQTMPATAEAIRSVNFGERGITGEELNQLKARYDENLLSADAEVAQLCQSLSALGIAEKTLIVVTADHGESFMEHGVLSHNLTVNEEVMWIPMVFSGPMLNDRAGERPAEIVRNVDLYPTLCAAMGAPTSDSLEGRNLLSGAVGDDGIRAFGQATYDRHPLEAYWWPRYKLIRDDYSACVEVYDLAMDPKEKNNLATPAPVLTDYLLANARLWKERGRARSTPPKDDVVISPDASKQLRSAGYMGY
jgi:arylsulfatase A-like enzyme